MVICGYAKTGLTFLPAVVLQPDSFAESPAKKTGMKILNVFFGLGVLTAIAKGLQYLNLAMKLEFIPKLHNTDYESEIAL